jgi:hypothetical protein
MEGLLIREVLFDLYIELFSPSPMQDFQADIFVVSNNLYRIIFAVSDAGLLGRHFRRY